MQTVCGSKTVLVLLLIFAGTAGFFANPLTTPIHEAGHVIFAILAGGGGEIAAWDMALISCNGYFCDWVASIGGPAFYSMVFIALSWFAARRGMYVLVAFFVGLILFEAMWFPGNQDYYDAVTNFPVFTWVFLVSNIILSPIAAGISVPVAIEFWGIPWRPCKD